MNNPIVSGILAAALVLAAIVTTPATARSAPSYETDPGYDMPGIGGSGGGDIPGGWTGGYGGGYGGPKGGRGWSGTRRATTVCTERGPCHKKRLRCPAKCARAWSKSGKNYGEGGGEGGCIVDCKKRCIAYC